MKYIYESPDKGKTVYRTPFNNPNAKRELVVSEDFFVEVKEDGTVILLEGGVGFAGFIKDMPNDVWDDEHQT